MPYDAFISYSHAADQRLAPRLQSALHGFAKPWYRLRAMHTFRDKTNLAATPQLWGSIQAALDDARYFILLASPEAAASPWVRQEVERWLATKGPQRLLIVITGGALVWDPAAGRFDDAATTALPPTLLTAFAEEPLHVDLSWAQHASQVSRRDGRFAEAVAQLAATVRGRPLDELAGEDVRQHRIVRATAATAVAGLVLLTIASTIGGYLAVQARQEAQAQRDQATRERNIAQSRLLASDAERTAAIRPNKQVEAARLALEALNRHPTVRANEVLRRLAGGLLLPYGAHRADDDQRPMDFSADGTVQAMVETSTILRILDAASGARLATITRDAPTQHQIRPWTSADAPVLTTFGAHVVWREGDGWLSVWDTRSGQRVGRHREGPFVLSPDGRHIAIWPDGVLSLTTLLAPRGALPLLRDVPAVRDGQVVAFSPDGRLLLARTDSGDTHIWRVADRQRLHVLPHAGPALPAAFSPDARRIATVGYDGVTVWSLADGSPARRLPAPGAVSALAWHPDGEHLALGSANRNWVSVQHLPSGEERFHGSHEAPVRALAFSDDGALLASASVDHTARVWDWQLQAEVARTVHMSQVGGVRFAAQDTVLVTSATATPTSAWRLRRPVMRHPLGPPGLATHDVDFSPDGATVAAGGDDGIVRIVDLATGDRLAGPPDHRAFCRTADDPLSVGLRHSPDGRLLATACGHDLWLWDRQTWLRIVHIADVQPVQQMTFSPDGQLIATGGNRGVVSVYAAGDGERIARFEASGVAWQLVFSGDGRHLMAASGGSLPGQARAVVWDLQAGRIARIIKHESAVQAASFSPDSTQLLTGSADGMAALTAVDDGRTLATFQHDSNVEAVAFDRTGTHTITADADGRVRVWRVPDGQPVRELRHDGLVTSMDVSPDGAHLATVGHDSQVHVWRLSDGLEMAREQLPGPATRVVFSPRDGRYVASAQRYGEQPGRVWLWPNADVRAEAMRRVGRTMTADERARYLQAGEGTEAATASR
jgi:WD40 repeat protein